MGQGFPSETELVDMREYPRLKFSEIVQSYEDKCRRCGECCRIKLDIPGHGRIIMDMYCPCLDLETKECLVYDTRNDADVSTLRESPCLPIEAALLMSEAPCTCAYAKVGCSNPCYDEARVELVSPEIRMYWKIWLAIKRWRIRRYMKKRRKR